MWRIRSIDVDSGRIGKTWQEWFFTKEDVAEAFLIEKVTSANEKELARTESRIREEIKDCETHGKKWSRLYRPDSVEDVKGWCVWAYGNMLTIDKIKVEK